MKTITEFAGQNWLITPAALAVGERQPTSIKDQKWLLTLTGVAMVNLTPNGGNTIRETLQILPDMDGPLKFAINRFSVPVPTNPHYIIKGLTKITPLFQLEEWSPFASLGSIFDKNESINAGFAVDFWRESPFLTLSANGLPDIKQIFQGIRVDVAVQDKDAVLHRVNYHISLLGKIVFAKPDPCQSQEDAVKAAQRAIEGLESQIISLKNQLSTASPAEKAAINAEIKRIRKEDVPAAEKRLEDAKKALAHCHLHPPLDNGGVLTP
jgi:hypothetical protein